MSLPASIRVLIADDFESIRAGLAAVISREPDMEVCALAKDGQEAIEMFREHQPDVTVMDMRMPNMDGATAIELIRAEFPQARFLVLTVSEERAAMFRALKAGATAYALKGAPRSEVIAQIRALHSAPRHSYGE